MPTVMLSCVLPLLLVLSPTSWAQTCGVGSNCKNSLGVDVCTPCPDGTTCNQFTKADGTLGAYYCQYTACLSINQFCANRVGTCCSGLECSLVGTQTVRTCNAIPTTTTTTTTTTSTTTTITTTTTSTTTTTTTTSTTTTLTTTTGAPTTTTTIAPIVIVPTAPCVTTSGAITGSPCVFPFIFNHKVYTSCTTAGGFSQPWCATAVNIFGGHITGQWGNCGSTCPGATPTPIAAPCATVSGATPGLPCIFPFRHWGKVYYSCTLDGGAGKPWCSTRVDAYGNHQLGNWGDCNTSTCKVA